MLAKITKKARNANIQVGLNWARPKKYSFKHTPFFTLFSSSSSELKLNPKPPHALAFPPPAATSNPTMAAAIAAAADDSIVYKLSALLEEVRPSAAALRAASEAADAVAGLVKRIPTQQATHEAVAGFVRDLGLAGEKLAFTFRPPEVVRVAGSHAAGGAVARPDVSADLLVRLPKV